MTDNVDMDRVIARIEKLLALANNNPNEAEAESAMRKAQELLEAYNLDMATIGAAKPDANKRDDKKRKGGLYSWQRKLWKSVAEMNFCYYLSVKGLAKGSQYEHRLIGSHANVVATELMAQYLQDTIEKLAQQWAKDNSYKSVFVREAIAYREGMTARVTERLEAKRAQMVRDAKEEARKREEARAAGTPTGTGLTIVDIISTEADFNNDYLNGYEMGTTARLRHEQEMRYQAHVRKMAEDQAEHERRMASDPAYAEEYRRKQAERAKADKEWWEAYEKKNKRRASRSVSSTPRPRPRAKTAEEKRMDLDSYWDGREDGAKVGIDTQIDNTKKARIA